MSHAVELHRFDVRATEIGSHCAYIRVASRSGDLVCERSNDGVTWTSLAKPMRDCEAQLDAAIREVVAIQDEVAAQVARNRDKASLINLLDRVQDKLDGKLEGLRFAKGVLR